MMPTGYIIFNTLVIRDSFYKKKLLVIIGCFLEHIILFFHGEFIHSSVVLLYVFSGVKGCCNYSVSEHFFISVVILKKNRKPYLKNVFNSSYDLIFVLIFSLFITLSICSGMGSFTFKAGSTTSKNLIGWAVSKKIPIAFG